MWLEYDWFSYTQVDNCAAEKIFASESAVI